MKKLKIFANIFVCQSDLTLLPPSFPLLNKVEEKFPIKYCFIIFTFQLIVFSSFKIVIHEKDHLNSAPLRITSVFSRYFVLCITRMTRFNWFSERKSVKDIIFPFRVVVSKRNTEFILNLTENSRYEYGPLILSDSYEIYGSECSCTFFEIEPLVCNVYPSIEYLEFFMIRSNKIRIFQFLYFRYILWYFINCKSQ